MFVSSSSSFSDKGVAGWRETSVLHISTGVGGGARVAPLSHKEEERRSPPSPAQQGEEVRRGKTSGCVVVVEVGNNVAEVHDGEMTSEVGHTAAETSQRSSEKIGEGGEQGEVPAAGVKGFGTCSATFTRTVCSAFISSFSAHHEISSSSVFFLLQVLLSCE